MSASSRASAFPFSAVVGQAEAKLALVLAAMEPRIGGVLLRGEKGTAKTTLARGLAGLLPGDAPFVELPLGASEDRVIGSIDLAAALTGGEVRFQPGLLAAAHGGVLYVDEVNLLADHLVDVLLDVAVSGVNRVEREGISHSHPCRFVLVGSMNPEEGELRPQLLDRFGFTVEVAASFNAGARAEAVRRRLDFDADPEGFGRTWEAGDAIVRSAISDRTPAGVDAELIETVSALCARMGAESLRADLAICRGAAALAGFEGRRAATLADARRVAPLALSHRRRRNPFDEPGISESELDEAMAPPPDEPSPERENGGGESEHQAEPDNPSRVVNLNAGRDISGAAGRRSTVEDVRGRTVTSREPQGPIGSVAVGATVGAAAARRAVEATPASPLTIEPADLREAVRERKAGNLIILAVDASASMAAERRMEAAKGAVLSLLLDAYQRRDRVAVVTFRGDGAEVALRPTGSVEVAKARLTDLSTGGRTPLAAGLRAAHDLAQTALQSSNGSGHRPLIVVVSDGRATAAPGEADALAAAWQEADRIRKRQVPAVVVDAEQGPTQLGLAAKLATAMGARHLKLEELSAGALTNAVRGAVRD